MSCTFIVSVVKMGALHPSFDLLDRWVPCSSQDESARVWRAEGREIHVKAWSTLAASARGSYWAWGNASGSGGDDLGSTCFQGWVREPDEYPLTLSVAEVLRLLCQRGDPDALDALHQRPGQFCLIYVDPELRVHGLSDGFCGQHLYYYEGPDRAVISNRASLIAAYLDGVAQLDRGHAPAEVQPRRPDPSRLGWLLARHESPVHEFMSAWSEIRLVSPGHRVVIDHSGLQLHSVALPERQRPDWDKLYEDLIWRAGQLRRLPEVPLRMALTGGFDSRLVLGALIGAELTERVEQFFVNATPEHADRRVAQMVADHYQLPFEARDAVDLHRGDPFLSQIPRHSFLIEYMINAWDLKSGSRAQVLPTFGVLPGHFGELYRSHAHQLYSHTHWTIRAHHGRAKMNRHSILSSELVDYYHQQYLDWFKERERCNVAANHVLDELHREARMWRWAAQTQMYESLGYPSFNLLPDLKLRAAYAHLSLRDRMRPRVHFELMRRTDEELAWLPFAKHQWPVAWAKRLGRVAPSPAQGAGNEVNAQIHMWRREQREICEFLLDEVSGSPWRDMVPRDALERRITFVVAQPTPQHVKGLLGAAAVKYALERDLTPHPLRIS